MTDKLETLATILGLTGLVVAIPLAYWWWVDRQPVAVFAEDQTPDVPVVPEASVCPDCEGEGWVEVTVRGYLVEVPCDECTAWDLAERAYERRQDV